MSYIINSLYYFKIRTDKLKKLILYLTVFLHTAVMSLAQPMQNRLLVATSPDGLGWVKSDLIIVDSADVPDAVIGPGNKFYLYYQGLVTPTKDGIKVAVSDNGTIDWQHYIIELPGTENWPGRPCDPDVIYSNGKFRLYFTGESTGDNNPETYSAISDDGIHFTQETGVRFIQPGYPVMDPSLLMIGDTLHYFAGGAPNGRNWHAISVDGLNFIKQNDFQIDQLMMANGIRMPISGYRFYCFSNSDKNSIYSVYSPDGQSWTRDSGARIRLDNPKLEFEHVKDPAVVYKDWNFYMYYVTRKQQVQQPIQINKKYLMVFHICSGTNCNDPRNHITKLAESDDLFRWNIVKNFPDLPGSVPDIITRRDKLYIYNPGQVKTYNNSTRNWEPPGQVSILDSAGNPVQYVDPSVILDDNGRIVLFFLNSNGITGQDPAGCKPYPCTKFFDSAIEEAGSDGKKFRLQPGHRFTIELQSGTASDPDIFYDGKKYILYISRGSSTSAYQSDILHGFFSPVGSLPSAILTNAGGVASGIYDSLSKQFYTYIHTRENGYNIIKVAEHPDFKNQLQPQDFLTAVSGLSVGPGSDINCESPGLAINSLRKQNNNGPWNNPLMLSFSVDGTNYSQTKIFQDSAGVPSAIRWKGDTLVSVFQWFREPIGSVTWDRVAVKFSYNNGISWTEPVPVVINGFPADYQRAFDPTLAVIDNNRLRIYFSSGIAGSQVPDSSINTYSAIGNDGIHYDFDSGARYDNSSRRVIDPAVIYFMDKWHYLSPVGAPQEGAYHCTSVDGLNFLFQNIIQSDNTHNWTGNFHVNSANELRFYGCGQNIWYNSSEDGTTWEGYTNTNIKGGDPAVVRLSDNNYLMIYVGQPYPENVSNENELFSDFVTVSPNPFNSIVNLHLKNNCQGLVNIKIYNVFGEETGTLVNKVLEVGNYSFSWNSGNYPDGIYFCVASAGHEISMIKLIKM